MPTLNINQLHEAVEQFGHVIAQPREGLRYVIDYRHDFDQYNHDLFHKTDERKDICLVVSPKGGYLHCDDAWYNAEIDPEPPYIDD